MIIKRVMVQRNGITLTLDVSIYNIISLNKLIEHLTTFFGDNNFHTYQFKDNEHTQPNT